MNVLSVFDGMSCGQIALMELGAKINKYYASEIDKPAIKQTGHIFPATIQLGSVTGVRAKNLDKIDLFIGGSPCQGFSFAGKQLNFSDPRSALFFEYVRLWSEVKAINPAAKFMLENVNMKKEHLRVISEYMGVFPVRINSNLVSAQNRDRWYWTNIRTKETGLFSELWSDIPQPADRGILLKDILQPEEEVPEKYFIKNKRIGFEGMCINGKNNTLSTGGSLSQSNKHNYDIIKLDRKLKEKPDQDKAGCLTGGGNSGGNHSDMDIICVSMVGRKINEHGKRDDYNPDLTTAQRLEPKTDGKTNCLTSVAKDNLVMCLTPRRTEYGKQIRKEYEAGTITAARAEISKLEPRDDGKTNTITTVQKDNLIATGYNLRRLTPLECSRLQTVPEWYEWAVSDTQIYKMLGNGWTVEVIKHIFSFLDMPGINTEQAENKNESKTA